ncbi:hypothetical protein MTO96_001236 [Rhipicephalus appendiculatus]
MTKSSGRRSKRRRRSEGFLMPPSDLPASDNETSSNENRRSAFVLDYTIHLPASTGNTYHFNTSRCVTTIIVAFLIALRYTASVTLGEATISSEHVLNGQSFGDVCCKLFRHTPDLGATHVVARLPHSRTASRSAAIAPVRDEAESAARRARGFADPALQGPFCFLGNQMSAATVAVAWLFPLIVS